jgi:septum formation protein
MRLILASESRARRRMLTAAGLTFEAIAAGIDEAALTAGMLAEDNEAAPVAIACHLARAKAEAVSRRFPEALVIGSDQVLAVGDQMLSKAHDQAEARSTLIKLRGRRHSLHSAVAVVRDNVVVGSAVDSARLVMRDYSDAFLDRYVAAAGDALTTCVGAYELEGPGIQLFETIDGDFHTILGMPLLPLLDILRREGAIES